MTTKSIKEHEKLSLGEEGQKKDFMKETLEKILNQRGMEEGSETLRDDIDKYVFLEHDHMKHHEAMDYFHHVVDLTISQTIQTLSKWGASLMHVSEEEKCKARQDSKICDCGDSTENKPICDTCKMHNEDQIRQDERSKIANGLAEAVDKGVSSFNLDNGDHDLFMGILDRCDKNATDRILKIIDDRLDGFNSKRLSFNAGMRSKEEQRSYDRNDGRILELQDLRQRIQSVGIEVPSDTKLPKDDKETVQ